MELRLTDEAFLIVGDPEAVYQIAHGKEVKPGQPTVVQTVLHVPYNFMSAYTGTFK